jgi:hypothetical protein
LTIIAIKLGTLALGMTLAAQLGNADVSTQVQPLLRIEKLWMLTYVNDDGVENIAQTRSPSGELLPLMAVDQERLGSIIELGRQVSAAHKIKLTLVELSNRSDVGEIKPVDMQPTRTQRP